jgi:hypothetical protein
MLSGKCEAAQTYASLNTAARYYLQQIRGYLHAVTDSSVTDEARAELDSARQAFREIYSDAQMILPDHVLQAAIQVSLALGDGYGMIKRLEQGKLRPGTPGSLAESPETISEFCNERLYERTGHLRQLMREDLGVASPELQNPAG